MDKMLVPNGVHYRGIPLYERDHFCPHLSWNELTVSKTVHLKVVISFNNRQFPWGVALLLEGKTSIWCSCVKMQARKCYIKSLSSVLKIKPKNSPYTYSCFLLRITYASYAACWHPGYKANHTIALCYLNWRLETIYRLHHKHDVY